MISHYKSLKKKTVFYFCSRKTIILSYSNQKPVYLKKNEKKREKLNSNIIKKNVNTKKRKGKERAKSVDKYEAINLKIF